MLAPGEGCHRGGAQPWLLTLLQDRCHLLRLLLLLLLLLRSLLHLDRWLRNNSRRACTAALKSRL
jgi:hypothetical protein